MCISREAVPKRFFSRNSCIHDIAFLVIVAVRFSLQESSVVLNRLHFLCLAADTLFCSYDEELDGVPIAHSDVRILSQSGSVHPYFPLIRVVVAADFVVFRPRPGARVTGRVNKISEDYIGLVVLGFMNAVIKRDAIRMDFHPVLSRQVWESRADPSHVIAVGDVVRFKIVTVEHNGPFASLLGALMSSDTGNADNNSVVQAVEAFVMGERKEKSRSRTEDSKEKSIKKKDSSKSKKKKKKKKERDEGTTPARGNGTGAVSPDDVHPIKRRKKESEDTNKKEKKKKGKKKKE